MQDLREAGNDIRHRDKSGDYCDQTSSKNNRIENTKTHHCEIEYVTRIFATPVRSRISCDGPESGEEHGGIM